jgi:hypothetical protein
VLTCSLPSKRAEKRPGLGGGTERKVKKKKKKKKKKKISQIVIVNREWEKENIYI